MKHAMASDDLSDQEKALFRAAMRDVKPLAENKKIPASRPKKLFYSARKSVTEKTQQVTDTGLSNVIQEIVSSEDILSYHIPGFPAKRFKQLKRGDIPWESRLDLHGLTTDEAQYKLLQFLQAQLDQRHRCVLIIHGKGGQDGNPPVLKNYVNNWLKQFTEVLAFHSALIKNGGSGATYVLLKSNKP